MCRSRFIINHDSTAAAVSVANVSGDPFLVPLSLPLLHTAPGGDTDPIEQIIRHSHHSPLSQHDLPRPPNTYSKCFLCLLAVHASRFLPFPFLVLGSTPSVCDVIYPFTLVWEGQENQKNPTFIVLVFRRPTLRFNCSLQ